MIINYLPYFVIALGIYLIFYGSKVHAKATRKYFQDTGLSNSPPWERDKSSTIIIGGLTMILMSKMVAIITLFVLAIPIWIGIYIYDILNF